jgi:hypothetical protein
MVLRLIMHPGHLSPKHTDQFIVWNMREEGVTCGEIV